MRSADGAALRFNGAGFLVEQRDRFGNGFTIEYEPTPLWELYTYYCNASELRQRNETKYGRRCALLAHLVGDETERAYRRGDALKRRRELMEAWAAYCAGK